MSDLIAIIFSPENFIFWAVEALRLCKTFSRDPPHALSKPTTCSLKTLHLYCVSYSLNPPPTLRTAPATPCCVWWVLRDRCDGMTETFKTGRSCCRSKTTNFSQKKIIAAVSGEVRPSFKINLYLYRTLPLSLNLESIIFLTSLDKYFTKRVFGPL